MRRSVGIVLFPEVEALAVIGPWQVFSVLRRIEPDACRLFTVSEAGGEVSCAGGLRLRADHAFAAAPRMDVLLVPGAVAGHQFDRSQLISYIRQAGAQADLIVSVCSGALFLEEAGFLVGKRTTADRSSLEQLRASGASEVIAGPRWIDAGAVITAAGGTAGIDVALYLVRRLWGNDMAQRVQQELEYCPQLPGPTSGGG